MLKNIFLWFKNTWTGNIIFVLFIINFLYQSFVIPSSSMRGTLLEGDFVLVNKYSYGLTVPRIPIIEQKIFPDFNNNNHILNGKGPKRGDIVVFRFPKNERIHYVKRAVAIENDILFVKNKNLYIHFNEGDEWIKNNYPNHKYFKSEKYGLFVKNPYKEEFKGIHNDKTVNYDILNKGMTNLNAQLEEIKENSITDKLTKEVFKLKSLKKSIDTVYNFPIKDNFDEKEMNNLILLSENDNFYVKVPKGEWFMMGDNRDHSYDSRFWGSIQYRHVVGKVASIWFSINLGSDDNTKYQIEWERIFRDINFIQKEISHKYL